MSTAKSYGANTHAALPLLPRRVARAQREEAHAAWRVCSGSEDNPRCRDADASKADAGSSKKEVKEERLTWSQK